MKQNSTTDSGEIGGEWTEWNTGMVDMRYRCPDWIEGEVAGFLHSEEWVSSQWHKALGECLLVRWILRAKSSSSSWPDAAPGLVRFSGDDSGCAHAFISAGSRNGTTQPKLIVNTVITEHDLCLGAPSLRNVAPRERGFLKVSQGRIQNAEWNLQLKERYADDPAW